MTDTTPAADDIEVPPTAGEDATFLAQLQQLITGPESAAGAEQAPAAIPPMPAGAPPVPIVTGTFAIYEDGCGGLVAVVERPGCPVERKHVPAQLIKMARRFGGGLLGG